jgi:hypothetical protein
MLHPVVWLKFTDDLEVFSACKGRAMMKEVVSTPETSINFYQINVATSQKTLIVVAGYLSRNVVAVHNSLFLRRHFLAWPQMSHILSSFYGK